MKKDGTLRVGIIGTGWIAEKAAITLKELTGCEALHHATDGRLATQMGCPLPHG
ncbi:MAG: hypothetical protein IKH01_01460 [Prevotella sp.]|nr:hypothetical protein [Prevotella sp.]